MREALARTDLDLIIAEQAPAKTRARQPAPAKPPVAPLKPHVAVGLRKRLMKRPLRTATTAAFGALLCGVVVNAVALQKGRHPAPLFAARQAAPEQAAAMRAPVQHAAPPAPAMASNNAVSQQPAASPSAPRPAVTQAAPYLPIHGAAPRPQHEARKEDVIGALIGREAPRASTSNQRVIGVQKALRKLGFALPVSGAFGPATKEALARFEKDHGLAQSAALSPSLVRSLSTRSGVPIP